MDSLIGIIVIILAILVVDRVYKWVILNYEKFKDDRDLFFKKTRIELDVLKVVSKHECFQLLKSDPTQFEKWIGDFLALKGYKIVEVTPPQHDGGKDLVVQNSKEEMIYVECKLWKPENWDTPVDRPAAQKLVGAMVADGIKKGLIITSSTVSENAVNYLKKVNESGYDVQFIDGDALVTELFQLREVKLPEIKRRLGINLIK